ncbi:alpha-N-acetylglucosaminidase [Kitasatospora nipponensis]|uniref:Alpha-N-acetylglucosaminidase n=1 Tax=Kitasatospora nipponensis TaxID=258049 RepID=A0ABP4GYU0_9ACTN
MTCLPRIPAPTRAAVLRVLAAGGLCAAAPILPAHARAEPAFDTAPAAAALVRLLPGHAAQFRLVATPRPAADSFSVSGRAGAVEVRGSSPATLLAGVGWYLGHVAGVDLGWPGRSTERLPAVLPGVPAVVTRSAVVAHRYALNDTDAGYSGAYRAYADYQHEIDLLALHGVNEVFVQTGAEYPYYQALQEFGYRPEELRAWIPAPAHQSWWLLQNMSGFGGPLPGHLPAERAALGRRIADQLRALGMTPVLPGFYGTVPPGFAERNPPARTVPQGDWVGLRRPDWLDPTGPGFARLAARYYAYQRAAFGDSTLYKMDLLHEGGRAADVDVVAAARAVQEALLTAHPDAGWAILGWQDNPAPALLAGVDRSRLLVLDGLSDRYDGLDRERQWGGTPYAFGAIDNFGGHTALGANSAVWTTRFRQWLERPGSRLAGLAYLPEGTGGNPAAFELFTELAWEPGPIDQQDWFARYAARRYGGADPHTAAAWELLRRSAYSLPSGTWSEPQDSLFTARPSLTATSSATWSPPALRDDPAQVRAALGQLLQAPAELRATDAYRFDLVDLARQVLTDRSRALLPLIDGAYRARDLPRLRALVAGWNAWVRALDALLATDSRFLLGPWLADARSWGASPAERDQLEYDARAILTTWAGRAPSEAGVHDYAAREWSGLVRDLYAPRWAAYFATLDTALADGSDPAPIDWFAVDDAWAHRTDGYPTTAVGDPQAAARAVLAEPPVQG